MLFRSVRTKEEGVQRMYEQLGRLVKQQIESATQSLGQLTRVLKSLSPQQVLKRGFSITRDSAGSVLKDASQMKSGQLVTTQLHRGSFRSTIK